jgi:23S rRNA (uridine2552-2'-O)-methyltransferase
VADDDKNKTGGNRQLHTRVRTAKGRKVSSTRWLERQLNDPYVQRAKIEGYRSRAAYKLLEIQEKFNIIRKGDCVVDLGAAPGGWCQVASRIVGKQGKVVGIDFQEMDPIENVTLLHHDFMADDAPQKLLDALGGSKPRVVLSDMAAFSTGHTQTDHFRIIGLCEVAFHFAQQCLEEEGVFVAKMLQGGTEADLLTELKKSFRVVKHFKPPASRKDSAEMFVVATGFRKNYNHD